MPRHESLKPLAILVPQISDGVNLESRSGRLLRLLRPPQVNLNRNPAFRALAGLVECPGDAVRCKAVRSGARLIWDKNRHQPNRGELDSPAPVHRARVCPTLSVMGILTHCDHIDGETLRRGRARIAGSAIAARFARFADCPASAGVPCRNDLGFPPAGSCGDRYWGSGRPPYY
jgi:hypothetical protein